MSKKLYTFNDPIYGFIRIRHPFLLDLINDPIFQRLRRISQMGLSYYVFPGVQHTRFEHALGSMHLMGKSIHVLRLKGVEITEEEEKGLFAAILLHDIGHGPFSHAMENILIPGVSHEEISLELMKVLNYKYEGVLQMAIDIYKGEYSKPFMNQLVASQLDMDRLDYLKRDSFYTGVSEGNINSERLISMLEVVDGQLAVEEKGVFSVEKFLMARRFMYWQVYLHKTSFVAEELLIKIFDRAKFLLAQKKYIYISKALAYFLSEDRAIDAESLNWFSKLDDVDVLYTVKMWQDAEDHVLSTLSTMLIERKLLAIEIEQKKISDSYFKDRQAEAIKALDLSSDEVDYFVFRGSVKNLAYNKNKQPIALAGAENQKHNFETSKEQSFSKSLSKAIEKHYICYPK